MRPSETWARKIDTPAAAPKAFRGFLPEVAAGAFPYTIYAPADRWGFRKVHPKLVALLESGVLWLELGREGVSRRIVPFTDVAWVEMGRILLHAWLRIALFHGEGVTRLELEFNSVVEGLFRRLAEAIRAAAARIPPAGAEALRQERDRLAFLYGVNHKFANFAKGSLIPGERALAAHFEPEVRRGRSGRIAAPARLAVLTDYELILVQDGRRRRAHEYYGGILSFIPRGAIGRLEAAAGAGVDPPGAGPSPAGGESLRRLVEDLQEGHGLER